MFPIKQLAQSLAVQGAGAIAPIVILPVIARTAGDGEWSSFVLGQAIGVFVSVVASFGWPISGISEVSAARAQERAALFALSITSRAVGFVLASAAAACVVIVATDPRQYFLTISVMLGHGFAGALSSNWYFVATGEPYKNLVYSTAPVIMASGATCASVLLGASVAIHGFFLSIAAFLFLIFASRREVAVTLTGLRASTRFLPLAQYYRTHASIAGGQILNALQTTSPIVAASLVLSIALADQYATADRLLFLSTAVLVSSANVLQAWSAERQDTRTSLYGSFLLVAVGSIGAATVFLFGDDLSDLIFGGQVGLAPYDAKLVALVILAISVKLAVTRLFAVNLRLYRLTLLGSAIGLATFWSAIVAYPVGDQLEAVVVPQIAAHVVGASFIAAGVAVYLRSR